MFQVDVYCIQTQNSLSLLCDSADCFPDNGCVSAAALKCPNNRLLSQESKTAASSLPDVEFASIPNLCGSLLSRVLYLSCKAPRQVAVTVRLRPQVPIKNIERELICPSCKELFTHPLILPCQHSICHKCVRELLLINHEDSIDAGSECSLPGSPRSRVPSPSMERLDRLVRSGGSPGATGDGPCWCRRVGSLAMRVGRRPGSSKRVSPVSPKDTGAWRHAVASSSSHFPLISASAAVAAFIICVLF